MVIDYRQLNKATKDDGYKIPTAGDLIDRISLSQPKFFSKFDLKSRYWQVKMEEESVPLTAFNAPQGIFEWLVMPFGLKNAPGVFQRKMDNAFKQVCKFCAVYIDDVLVYSQTEDDHMRRLDRVTDVFRQEGMILSERKIECFKELVNFLGMEIEKGKIKLQNHIAEKIVEFPDRLEDRKQVQRFCGFVNYARKFVKDLSQDLGLSFEVPFISSFLFSLLELHLHHLNEHFLCLYLTVEQGRKSALSGLKCLKSIFTERNTASARRYPFHRWN
ncbi:hypothetical protein MLD38_036764 [Melastoma candidum]|uniref:Uncharacterized protein n=1 Tax=Melastoma candidum TaxID=119954 RepID=A0ACB9LMJ9_9MYRT|nr:hypothetical protein MLD38_036764 [Melastoma candidum]